MYTCVSAGRRGASKHIEQESVRPSVRPFVPYVVLPGVFGETGPKPREFSGAAPLSQWDPRGRLAAGLKSQALCHRWGLGLGVTERDTGRERETVLPLPAPSCAGAVGREPQGALTPALTPLPLVTKDGSGAASPSRGAANHKFCWGVFLFSRFPAVGVGGERRGASPPGPVLLPPPASPRGSLYPLPS